METKSFVLDDAGHAAPPQSTQEFEQSAGVGFSSFFKDRAAANMNMVERATALHILTRCLKPGEERAKVVLAAVQVLFGDIPQTWAAWDNRTDAVKKRRPDETVTFFPEERLLAGRWILDQLDRQRTIMFLIPLEGPEHIPGSSDQDWRGFLYDVETVHALADVSPDA